jgi:hypothetical protein
MSSLSTSGAAILASSHFAFVTRLADGLDVALEDRWR